MVSLRGLGFEKFVCAFVCKLASVTLKVKYVILMCESFMFAETNYNSVVL